MELNRSTMKKLIFLIVLVFLLFAGAQNIATVSKALRFLLNIISPFIAGGAIAFVLNVPLHFLETRLLGKLHNSKRWKKLARPLSLLLTLLLVVLVILLLLLVIIPQLGDSITSLSASIQSAVPRFITWAEEMFANNPQIVEWLNSLTFDWDKFLDTVINFLQNGAGNMLNSTISAARSVISAVTSFFIAFVFACYILLQKEKLGRQFRKALYALFPQTVAQKTMSVASLSYRIFSSFITGQCIEAVILGSMFFITLSLLRLPYALLIGCLISVTALIPIVGAFIGCAVGAFLLLMVSPAKALLFIIIFLVLQQVEGNLIYPHVVGSSVGLPSIWVLMAVTLGGSFMGVFGMLLFIPLTSVVYTLFRGFVNQRLKEKQIQVE